MEGLRGVAALVVVFFHFIAVFYPAMIDGDPLSTHLGKTIEIFLSTTPLNVLYNGTFAVGIFFILSAYVLTYKFFKDKNRQRIYSGVIRRYFRLLPIVLISTIGVYLFLNLSLFYNIPIVHVTGGILVMQWTTLEPIQYTYHVLSGALKLFVRRPYFI